MRKQTPPYHDDTKPGPLDGIRTITRMIVAGGRQTGEDDDTIRAWVQTAIKEALDGSNEWKPAVALPGQDKPEQAVSTAGMYRLVFECYNLDRANLHAQERWHQTVLQELERTLRRNDGTSAGERCEDDVEMIEPFKPDELGRVRYRQAGEPQTATLLVGYAWTAEDPAVADVLNGTFPLGGYGPADGRLGSVELHRGAAMLRGDVEMPEAGPGNPGTIY